MIIVTSSASFDRHLADGTLTQLEWLDVCANDLRVDGVAFDTAHFPRRDADYLAQLRKTAVDLGLAMAAVQTRAAATGVPDAIALAVTLGAPLVIFEAPPAADEPGAWPAFVRECQAAASLAKGANVTLAVRNVPGTLVALAADLRALAKDVDSAWLRYALDVVALGSDARVDAVTPRTAIAMHRGAETAQLPAVLATVRGPLVIDRIADGEGAPEGYAAMLRRARVTLGEAELARLTR